VIDLDGTRVLLEVDYWNTEEDDLDTSILAAAPVEERRVSIELRVSCEPQFISWLGLKETVGIDCLHLKCRIVSRPSAPAATGEKPAALPATAPLDATAQEPGREV
jgi:hypothetical protein